MRSFTFSYLINNGAPFAFFFNQQAGVITLADNDPFAHYRYDVTIVTGMRRGAGTTAVATLTLVGSDGKSRPQLLAAPGRQVMQRGSADSFIITTRESIGEVTEVRIWHDNAGDSPEWYATSSFISHSFSYFNSDT